MSVSRRKFFTLSAVGAAGVGLIPGGGLRAGPAVAAGPGGGAGDPAMLQDPVAAQPSTDLDATGLAEAQKVFGLNFSEAEREQMLGSLRGRAGNLARVRANRALANGLAPAASFDPRLPGYVPVARPQGFQPMLAAPRSLPTGPNADTEIAFAPVWRLASWLRQTSSLKNGLTSERLTKIYLDRLRAHDPKLLCAVTITADLAMAQARQADQEFQAGKDRGPLHGIPYGAKDLFDTKGIATTWGAAPFRDRVADRDAWVVQRMQEAGAVLLCKTTLGALAMGDVWFGGRTKNPFDPERGSSGSSAGSAAATAAGLVGFALGTETLGSIVSPCMRCGTTGLRPTFGRVGRGGAMALCWSMDKVGPITRCVEDSVLVLDALRGLDPDDPACSNEPLHYDATWETKGRKVGYVKGWFGGRRGAADQASLDAARELGWELVAVEVPSDPMDGELRTILNVEAAAAFEELTLSNEDDKLSAQHDGAWPNSFRKGWFTSAVDLMQAMRHRRRVCERMVRVMEPLDALLTPSYGGDILLLTNMTGHPALVLRSGFRGAAPTGVSLIGNLYDEGMLVRLGRDLEAKLGVWERRPELG